MVISTVLDILYATFEMRESKLRFMSIVQLKYLVLVYCGIEIFLKIY